MALSDTSTANIVYASGCPAGVPLLVTATTSGTAQTLDTAVTGATAHDEMYICANNNGAADVILSLEIGSSTNTLKWVIPGTSNAAGNPTQRLMGGDRYNNATTFKVYAATGSVINVWVSKNRITE